MNEREELTEKQQREYLLRKIRKPVVFKYPEPPIRREGTLIDRFIVRDSDDGVVTYWNLIDLIKFPHYKENWLRITYYRYKKQERKWVFAGQTSFSDPMSAFETLFINAIKEKEWIRPLFKQILRKCAKELE